MKATIDSSRRCFDGVVHHRRWQATHTHTQTIIIMNEKEKLATIVSIWQANIPLYNENIKTRANVYNYGNINIDTEERKKLNVIL